MNVLFVLWGKKYNSEQVETLYHSLKKFGPEYNYYCFTDQDVNIEGLNVIKIPKNLYLPGVWNKLYMFSKKFKVRGKIYYFDIDVAILENPFKIDVNWEKLNLIYSSHKKIKKNTIGYDVNINSSVMAWDNDNLSIRRLWNHFDKSGYSDYFLRKYAGIDRYIVHEDFEDLLDFFPLDYTKSFKYEKEKEAPIVTFEELDFGSIDIKSELESC